MNERFDVAIIGSGFAGSILAWILSIEGLKVALIDSARHPRFAIGESSTPIADAILRRLGFTHRITELQSLAAWGSWQRHHGDLACGRKRGFSYYVHRRGEAFCEASAGERSLLVAASAADQVADTHWYRPDVDRFLFRCAINAGATDLSGHQVVAHDCDGKGRYRTHCDGQRRRIVHSDWVIDASGQAGVLARLTGAADLSDQLETRTHATYGHFIDVPSWTSQLESCGIATGGDPFDGDDAAQHHLLQRGWTWMLRFNNGITSVGYTAPTSDRLDEWSAYPSIGALMRSARLVAPSGGPVLTGRLQRFFEPLIDSRRILLPTAAATIDPLHSAGIAHALAGVERVSKIILCADPARRDDLLAQYGASVRDEIALLDRLVSTAYETMHDFGRFTAACMLYFAGAIRCEEKYLRGETPSHLWSVEDPQFVRFVNWACGLLRDPDRGDYETAIRDRLAPWNSAGLMDPDVANRYAYTATKQASSSRSDKS